MNLKVRGREEPQVNLTSLIDVVFLLLIFFMVSTSFIKESEISIRLPEADATPLQAERPETVEILVTAGGTYWINGRELVNNRRSTLAEALREVSAGDTSLPVVLSADADARHQFVVTAMDVAGELGFRQWSIATVNLPDED
ncbi:MAG: biopolymer transporter ExbD [Pseudomonadota bacterium]